MLEVGEEVEVEEWGRWSDCLLVEEVEEEVPRRDRVRPPFIADADGLRGSLSTTYLDAEEEEVA